MKHIIILGGGYVGLHAYRSMIQRLSTQIKHEEVNITVVNNTPYHAFHGFTGEVVGDILPLEATLIPIQEVFNETQIVEATVQHVNLDEQHIQIEYHNGTQNNLSFDHLLIAIGSRDPLEWIPGSQEHSWRLKNAHDMKRFYAKVQQRFAQKQPTTFAVIGGGPSGVEMAVILKDRLDQEQVRGEVHLFSADGILDIYKDDQPHIVEHTYKTLKKAGIHLHTHQKVTQIIPTGIHLANDQFYAADEILFAAGIAQSKIPGTEELPRNRQGRLLTDEYLHVQGHPNIWVGGDTAVVAHPNGQGDCPATALWAIPHGKHIGQNIANTLQHRPLKPFKHSGLEQSASLGFGNGITEIYGRVFVGFWAWVLRLIYFIWIMPSRRQRLQVSWAFIKAIFASKKQTKQNKDIEAEQVKA